MVPPMTALPRLLRHGPRFAGHCCLVHLRLALDDDTVSRNARTRADENDIVGTQFGDRYFAHASVWFDTFRCRRE